MKRIAWLPVLLAALGLALPLGAQEEESLFEGPLVAEPAPAPAGDAPAGGPASPEQEFLTAPRLEWGGSFETRFDSTWGWAEYPSSGGELFDPASALLDTEVRAALFFDARPRKDFRTFGKVKADYAYTAASGEWGWDARIHELFADFQWGDRVFFRAGKHTIQWGVGYFFSPADVLNLVSIDPADPTAEREGPVAVKAQVPFGVHNAYLYLVANDIRHPGQIGVAPKVELVLGGCELGIGGFYQTDLPVSLALTATGPLGNLDWFTEAVLQYAHELTAAPLVFSATGGAAYLDPDGGVSAFLQFLYAERVLAAADLEAAAVQYPGTYRLAASLAWTEILESDFGLSVLWLACFSDASGRVQPVVSWQPLDYVQLRLQLALSYGEAGSEYAPLGALPAVTVGLTLGQGRF